MQLNDYKRIEELLERFFDGETSIAEEKELYQFFKRQDLPENLEQYRSVFAYFESGIAEEVNDLEELEPAQKKSFVSFIIAGIAIAASFLLFFVFNNQHVNKEDESNPYAGSYIIHNGVIRESKV